MKIKCVNNIGNENTYTSGKIYDFEPGKGFVDDKGEVRFDDCISFEMLKKFSGAIWELVENESDKIKIRCVKRNGKAKIREGEVYLFELGKGLVNDLGDLVFHTPKPFNAFKESSVDVWELVKDESTTQEVFLLRCLDNDNRCGFTVDKVYPFTVGKGLVDNAGTILWDWCKSVEEVLSASLNDIAVKFELVEDDEVIEEANDKTAAYLQEILLSLEEEKKANSELQGRIDKLTNECRVWEKCSEEHKIGYDRVVNENNRLHEKLKELKEELNQLNSKNFELQKLSDGLRLDIERKNINFNEILAQANKYGEDLELIKSFVNRIME